PAAHGAPLVRVGLDGDAVAREAVGGCARSTVGDLGIVVVGGSGGGPANRAGQVRAVARIARADLVRVFVQEGVPVDPFVSVSVARVLHVVRLRAELRAARLAE